MAPDFELDFTDGVLAPSVSITRALNTATSVNSSGYIATVNADLPRFDYDPVSITLRGLLIEESRTNSLLQSNTFNNAVWTAAFGSVSLVSGLSPDGASNVFKFTPSAPNASFRELQQNINLTAGTTYCYSQYVKADSYRYVQIIGGSGSFGTFYVNWDLLTGTETAFSAGSSTVVGRGIINCGNGYYRVWAAVTALATVSGRMAVNYIGSGTAIRGAAWVADGVNGYLIYGAQLEIGAFPTSYIPTTTTALTRNADVATITGTNFSDWWQDDKGGVLVGARPSTVSGTRPWVQFDDGTANEIITLRGNTTNPELYIVDGGVAQAQLDAGTIAANTDYSMSAWWATNDCKVRLDGNAAVTDLTATIPTVTQMRIGSDGTNYLNGHIASIGYYDTFSGQIYARRKNKAVFSLV